MSFEIPMVWQERKNHVDDCCFCITKAQGFSNKSKHRIQYPSLDSAILPASYSYEIPVTVFAEFQDSNDSEFNTLEEDHMAEADYLDISEINTASSSSRSPQCFNQSERNDLVRDFGMSKESSELLHPGTRITYYRKRDNAVCQFFRKEEDIFFCDSIKDVLEYLGVDSYDANDWHLFLNSSKRSLNCVLLHNCNEYASVPIGHSVRAKETYASLKQILSLIKYEHHNWVICVNLKMVNFLLGQQCEYTKFPCFLC